MMSDTPSIRIVVATHKAYRMPADAMYLPLHVGAEGKMDADGKLLDLGFQKDNAGDNISARNPSFCELTGLYWAWKHLDADYIGLVHYRRHFGSGHAKDPFANILTYDEIASDLGRIKVFVPKKRHYVIETLYSHYAHTHDAAHLDEARQILRESHEDYVEDFDRVARQRQGYMFNMMILTRPLMDDYCSWLFDVLFELENRIGTEDLSAFQARLYGRVSEILFNVWLTHMIRIGNVPREEVKELPYLPIEREHWWKKGKAFLRAKLFHRKYESSF